MPRVVSLYLPCWATDRIRKHARSGRNGRSGEGAPSPERPLVTVTTEGTRRIIAAANRSATVLGLRSGQPVAQAQASVPDLVLVDATPEADAMALTELAGWCLRYAPVVQPDPPDGIFIDIAGADHLFGGEPALLADVTRRLTRAGLQVKAGLADTAGAAWAAARFGHEPIIPRGGAATALAGLPVAALRLAPEICDALARLGIERIGQLEAMPRAQLTLRFGPQILERYDRAHGQAADPLTPLIPLETPQVRLSCPEPLGHLAALQEAVTRLAADLCRVLEAREEGLRLLDAVFRRVDGRPLGIRVGTARATRDPLHCTRLLAERLPEIDPGFGIDEVVLVAARSERLEPRQALGLHIEQEADLGPLVDRLGVRLGAEHVFRAAPVESEYPERSVQRVAALAPASGGSWPERLPRPSRLVDPPEPVQAIALAPDNPPALFTWRRQRYRVRHADGPERIRGEWWMSDAELHTLRDYYRVEDDKGRRFWLFRDAPMGEGHWWLQGFFS
jgi:protein ImuB